MGCQGAADFALAQIYQAELLPATGPHLGAVFQVPALASIIGADQGDERARMGMANAAHFLHRGFAESQE